MYIRERVHIIFVLALLLASFLMRAQNLVPNPSFEDIESCPTVAGDIRKALPWFEPVNRSTDLYHSCATGDWSVGNNIRGEQLPDSGKAYAGIRVYADWFNTPNYREYLSVKLIDTLKKGKNYKVSFKVNLADGGTVRYAIDQFGAWFSKGNPRDTILFEVIPQVESPEGQFLIDFENWTQLTMCFNAEGGEQYLTLGNFRDDNRTQTLEVFPFWGQTSFYFIDDVIVEEVIENPVELGPDTLICNGLSYIYKFDDEWPSFPMNVDFSYEGDQITVIGNNLGCVFYDTLNINYLTNTPVDLGLDTILCIGDTLILSPNLSNVDYLWQDSSSRDSLVVVEGGEYSVQVSDSACTTFDTILVHFIESPTVELGADTILCEHSELVLTASSDRAKYRWIDLTDADTLLVLAPGLYWVEVKNVCGSATDSIYVKFELQSDILIPNIITPNGDGKNDTFVISNIDVCQWEIEVYNRWGHEVYKNHDYDNSWSPNHLKNGMYYYSLSDHERGVFLKGWVKIVR